MLAKLEPPLNERFIKIMDEQLRIDRELQEEFDALAAKSDRSRNELMCMALRYALDHLVFIPQTCLPCYTSVLHS